MQTFFMALTPHKRKHVLASRGEKEKEDMVLHVCRREKVENYWFCANVRLRTPLAVLEQHGAIHPGPPTRLPQYGTAKEGQWLPLYKTTIKENQSVQVSPRNGLEKQGLKAGNILSHIDSDIGPIPSDGGDYLRFVKAFRRIIESKETVDTIVANLKALLQQHPRYQAFARMHAPDFVTTWFLNTLLTIPGLDPKSAQRLFTVGYRTPDELKKADDLILRQKAQIDEATIMKIHNFFGSPTQPEREDGNGVSALG